MIPVAPPYPFQVLRCQIRSLTVRIRQPCSDEHQQFPTPRGECTEQRLRFHHFRCFHLLLQHRPLRLEVVDVSGFQQFPHVLLDPIDHSKFGI